MCVCIFSRTGTPFPYSFEPALTSVVIQAGGCVRFNMLLYLCWDAYERKSPIWSVDMLLDSSWGLLCTDKYDVMRWWSLGQYDACFQPDPFAKIYIQHAEFMKWLQNVGGLGYHTNLGLIHSDVSHINQRLIPLGLLNFVCVPLSSNTTFWRENTGLSVMFCSVFSDCQCSLYNVPWLRGAAASWPRVSSVIWMQMYGPVLDFLDCL